MKLLKKNGKTITLLLIIIVILALAVYGLISIIGNITKTNKVNDSTLPVVTEIPGYNTATKTDNPVSSIDPVNSTNPTEKPIPVNKEVSISFSLNSLIIENPRENLTFINSTGENKLVVFIEDSICNNLGYWELESSDYAKGFSVREENGGVLVTVDIGIPFTVNETLADDNINLEIAAQKNTQFIEYRNDLTRIYMNIQEARLSKESDSFIKNYTEIFDEFNLTYTITIPKSKMPDLLDETIILNDGIIKNIKIVNRSNDVQLIFEVYEKIIIYPNTRDYDAAFTFIPQKNGNTPLIVLDPGHGGIDGGTTNSDQSVLEKNIVLNMCKMIHDKLISYGYNVINLREEDIFLGLMERTDIANLADADAIVSVHVNSYTVEHVNGATSLYKTSGDLAEAIQREVVNKSGAYDRGTIRMIDLSILNRAEMEAVIIETGFLSNNDEAILLNTVEYQEKIANGIAIGINNFFEGN